MIYSIEERNNPIRRAGWSRQKLAHMVQRKVAAMSTMPTVKDWPLTLDDLSPLAAAMFLPVLETFHRRSISFYGAVGVGKTSLTQTLSAVMSRQAKFFFRARRSGP